MDFSKTLSDYAFTTELHATQDTYIQLRNEEVDSLRLTGCLDNLCANNHHFLDVKVQNTIMFIIRTNF